MVYGHPPYGWDSFVRMPSGGAWGFPVKFSLKHQRTSLYYPKPCYDYREQQEIVHNRPFQSVPSSHAAGESCSDIEKAMGPNSSSSTFSYWLAHQGVSAVTASYWNLPLNISETTGKSLYLPEPWRPHQPSRHDHSTNLLVLLKRLNKITTINSLA